MTTVASPSPFARELRRWRALRRWSQLDLAIRADTTQRYLSYLEQGRSQPGRAMVLRLAESLELSLRERNQLLNSAGYAPAYDESGYDAPQLAAVREALRSVLAGHMPYPALIADRYGDLIESNAAFDLFTAGCAPELLTPPVNVRRLALHPDGLAPRVINFADWGRHVTESMRARNRTSPDPLAEELVAEFETYLPAVEPGPGYLGFAVPLRLRWGTGELRLITTLTSFATATDVSLADLHLEAFLPADDATADLLRRRAAESDGPLPEAIAPVRNPSARPR
ncbi:MmyB family transcriptional regulator [Nocardia veterana]|uniref:Helix-turn-helix transcriptional regulator n=1 Tax=Nocardia veterana TaxID=132249 RepID=A0A7X6RKU9_9NOCA|nr:helix-turn-helix domain-containing protein [Nocardia veterana]NKY89078.1 helix-turn-helix transcriptional regulator [Nocardia veterana]